MQDVPGLCLWPRRWVAGRYRRQRGIHAGCSRDTHSADDKKENRTGTSVRTECHGTYRQTKIHHRTGADKRGPAHAHVTLAAVNNITTRSPKLEAQCRYERVRHDAGRPHRRQRR